MQIPKVEYERKWRKGRGSGSDTAVNSADVLYKGGFEKQTRPFHSPSNWKNVKLENHYASFIKLIGVCRKFGKGLEDFLRSLTFYYVNYMEEAIFMDLKT